MKSSQNSELTQIGRKRANAVRPPYDRETQLPGLIGLWPSELRDQSLLGTTKITALLRKALRSERLRGRAGHWSYDLNRHLALVEALKAERACLLDLQSASSRLPRALRAANIETKGRILALRGDCRFAARTFDAGR